MRQLPSQFFTAGTSAPPQTYMQCIVPRGSWGFNKLLLMRIGYQLLYNSLPNPPGLQLNELVNLSGLGSNLWPSSAGTPPTNPISYSVQERALVRINNTVWAFDYSDIYAHSYFHANDGTEYFFECASGIPDTWFAAEQTISLEVSDPSDSNNYQIIPIWCEAFLEQGTNLGALT